MPRHKSLFILRELCLLFCSWSLVASAAHAQTEHPETKASPSQSASHPSSAGKAITVQQRWSSDMRTRRVPQSGCFSASFPDKDWRAVPCVTPPPRNPIPPKIRRSPTGAITHSQAKGGSPEIVGNEQTSPLLPTACPMELPRLPSRPLKAPFRQCLTCTA